MITADGARSRLAAFGNLFRPGFYVAHHRVESFAAINLPLSNVLTYADGSPADIRAIVLDKDDCFARPLENEVYGPFQSKFQELRKAYPGSQLVIVSNSAGSQGYDDAEDIKAKILEKATEVDVFRHKHIKPFCWRSILAHILDDPSTGATHPSHIAVIGDSERTDMIMANTMGSWAIKVGRISRAIRNKTPFKVLGWHFRSGQPFNVTEKIKGTFRNISNLPAFQILLQRVHKTGIFHGDINRYNFVNNQKQGRTWLIDWENAKKFTEEDAINGKDLFGQAVKGGLL